MLIALLRKLFLTLITLCILSMISYGILLRDPIYELETDWMTGYVDYLVEVFQGDLGISHSSGEPLLAQILSVFPATISLTLSAISLALLFGIPLGFFTATQRHNLLGKLLISLSSLSLAIPVFWLAIVMLAYTSLNGWAIASVGEIHPIYDVPSITGVKVWDILLSDSPDKLMMLQSALQHLVLPTLILALPATLETVRMTQERTTYVLKQNYVKVARARGWSPYKVWWNHIIRNTLPPLVPMIAHNVTLTFAFSMLVENIISWGGIGRWLVNALSVQDYSAISAGVVAIGVFVLSVDLLASLIRTLLDPSQKKDWYNVK